MRQQLVLPVLALLLALGGCHDLDKLSEEFEDYGDGSGGVPDYGGGGQGGQGVGGTGSGGVSSIELTCDGLACSTLSNPEGGALCCTAAGAGVFGDDDGLTGTAPHQCGVDLSEVRDVFGDSCWQLAQPGAVDGGCPAVEWNEHEFPGCCTPEGFCGVQDEAYGLGCSYAYDGVGRPCGSNPVAGCGIGPYDSCEDTRVCRPVYFEDRQVGTYACVESFDLPLYGPGEPCGEGWYPTSLDPSQGSITADPCGEGLVCVYEEVLSQDWVCRPYCDEESLCGGDSERCIDFTASSSSELHVPSCHITDNCRVAVEGMMPDVGLPLPPSGCGEGEICYLSYDWNDDQAFGECFVPELQDGLVVGDPCTLLNICPPGSVCIGPVGVDPDDWGDGEAVNDFRCTRACGDDATGAPPSPDPGACDCRPLSEWYLQTAKVDLPPKLCALPPAGDDGGGMMGTDGCKFNGNECAVFDGMMGYVAFVNDTASDMTLVLWHPDTGEAYTSYYVAAGSYWDSDIVVGDDWGVQILGSGVRTLEAVATWDGSGWQLSASALF